MNPSKVLIIVVFVAAVLVRFADVFRPINQASWRECDLGGISRNFVTEGMNPLYPRIDWRGDGPGYTEMELPVFSYLTAVTYKIFGVHDQIGRVWAFLFSLGAMFFFFKLAREYLSIFASTVAFAFLALNPLMSGMATAIQPEGMMIFTYIAAVYFFVRWLKTDRSRYFWAATAATALTLLLKVPAAHIGLLFGILLIKKYGRSIVKEWRVWTFAILSLLPSALWYLHAKNLWIVYGNSLGVSNEYHWVGLDFFTDSQFITGILRIELTDVWMRFGLTVGAFAIWRGYREQTAQHVLLWLASIFSLYFIAARTTSEEWASYYHIFSIPPVALLFGFSIKKLWDYAREFADAYSKRTLVANLSRIVVIFVVIGSILVTFMIEAKIVRANFVERRHPGPAYVFAQQIKPRIESEGPILVSGGHCLDPKGYYVAYNAPYMFYWLEKKGWNICVEDQSLAKVQEFRSKGVRYFIAEKSFMREMPGFEQEIESIYPTLAETDSYALFELTGAR